MQFIKTKDQLPPIGQIVLGKFTQHFFKMHKKEFKLQYCFAKRVSNKEFEICGHEEFGRVRNHVLECWTQSNELDNIEIKEEPIITFKDLKNGEMFTIIKKGYNQNLVYMKIIPQIKQGDCICLSLGTNFSIPDNTIVKPVDTFTKVPVDKIPS